MIQKTTDGGAMIAGTIAAVFNAQLPLAISILTIVLLSWRIYIAYLDSRLKRKELEK